MRIDVASEAGVVTLADSGQALPAGLDQEALLRQLEPLARSGALFFLAADDPVRYRIDVLDGEALPAGLEAAFEPFGGSFRVDLPSGTAAVSGWDEAGRPQAAGTIALRPGTHVLSVWARRPFDGARHGEEMADLLGAEWRFMRTVDKLGLLGCLPMVATAACVLAGWWQWLWYALPLLAASWTPYALLKRGKRYQAAERRAFEHETARPHYVLGLSASRQDRLPGGFLRV